MNLSLRQAGALIQLRATLTWRAVVQQRAWGRLAFTLFAIVAGALGSLGMGLLVFEAAGELARDPGELAHRGGPLAVFATWLAMALAGRLWFSVRALGGGGAFLDPRRFLPYAVPARLVSAINFAAALVEPTWLFFYPPLYAIGLAAATLPGAPPAWALLAAEGVAVLAAGGLLHLLGALGNVLQARPALQRALLVFLAFAGFAAFQLAAAHPGRRGLAQLFAERRWQLIAWTPPGWAAVLARALADHSALHAFTPALLLCAIAAAAVYTSHRLALRESLRPAPTARLSARAAAGAGWKLPLLPDAFSALFEKEAKTQLRSAWLQLVIVPAGFLILRTAFIGARPASFGGQPLLLAAAYAHLGILEVATNAFGRDVSAARGWFFWPVSPRALFAAKNAVAYCFSLVLFLVLAAVVAFSGRASPLQLLIGLLAHAATFPLLVAFGNAASVLWPMPLRTQILRRVRGAGPIGARLFAVALLGVAAWAPFALARLLGLPVLFAYAGALVVGAVTYGGLLAFSAALLVAKREPMLMALSRDE